MIQYSLRCAEKHQFDSWFQSAAAYDKLAAAGLVTCAICGSEKVEKAIMAPRVSNGTTAAGQVETEKPTEGALSAPASPTEQALAKLREHVEKNSDYVGSDFASEARAMHEGETPERAIHGEARGDEARKLIEDGVPVAPLPFTLTRKTN